MRYELRRIEIWPVAKVVFILSLFLGFFIGVLYGGLFALVETFASSEEALFGGESFSGAVSFFAIVVIFTLLIPLVHTVFSVIFVALYNLVASWFGGFRVEFQSIDDQAGDRSPVG